VVKLGHLRIAASDWRRSRDWYVGHLGFSVEFEPPAGGASGLGAAALRDDAGLTALLEQRSEPILSGRSSYTPQVDDVDLPHARLRAEGLNFPSPPEKYFWGCGAVLADPDGHLLALYDEASMAATG
jgi:catechol 2,3-dioxygenase-like lactoylglutathione lyase family enzyme